jgi:hypothetical protein
MRWRNGLLTASSALLLVGCGGGSDRAGPPQQPPRIPAGLGGQLAAEADRIAGLAPGSCAAKDAAFRFRANVLASIDRVPARYRRPLMNAANDLAERLAACTAPPERHGHGERGEHGKHGKHGHDEDQGNEGDNG